MKMFFLIGLWYVRFLPALQLAGIINLFDAIVLSQWKWLFWEELMLYFWASHKNILDKVQPELTFFPLVTLSAKALCWRIADMLEYFSISLLCNVMLLRECTQMHPSPVWHTEKCCEAEQSQYYKTLPSVVFFFFPPSDTASNFFMPAFLYLTVEWSCFTPTTLWTHLGL